MWNPPLIDERTGARGSPLGEAADLLADLVEKEVRTICFLRSRRGVELIQRFAAPAPGGPRPRRPGRADRALPRRLHAVAAARDRAAADGRRAAGRGVHRRAGAGHRHRRAGRRDLRDLPGHGGQPAPDVGPRRAPRHRAGAVRGGRRRARPVLLPPPRRVPRAAGGVGHPRPRVRGDPPGPPRGGGLRAAAHARRRGVPRRRLGARRPGAWCRWARCASAAGATCPAARASPRRRSRCGPRRPTRWRSSRARAAR